MAQHNHSMFRVLRPLLVDVLPRYERTSTCNIKSDPAELLARHHAILMQGTDSLQPGSGSSSADHQLRSRVKSVLLPNGQNISSIVLVQPTRLNRTPGPMV